jgi:hypothetical protein
MFQTTFVDNIKTHVLSSIFFFENRAVYKIMCKDILKAGRAQLTIWRMRPEFWIPKAINTHSEYVLFLFLYSSPNIVRVIKSRRMRWAGHVARMGRGRGVYKVLVGKPEVRRPLGRPRHRWEDNIRMDVRKVGCGCVDWMELALDRDRWRALVSAVMSLRVP